MYSLIINDSYCQYKVKGGISGENQDNNCIIDGNSFYYEPVICIDNGKGVYWIRLSNSDEFVDMVREGLFKFPSDKLSTREFENSKNLNLVAEIVDKIASKLENIKVEEREECCLVKYKNKNFFLFNVIGIPFEVINEGFDLSKFFTEGDIFEICDNCRGLTEKYYYNTAHVFCSECFDKINFKCSKIGGNEKLASELMLKTI